MLWIKKVVCLWDVGTWCAYLDQSTSLIAFSFSLSIFNIWVQRNLPFQLPPTKYFIQMYVCNVHLKLHTMCMLHIFSTSPHNLNSHDISLVALWHRNFEIYHFSFHPVNIFPNMCSMYIQNCISCVCYIYFPLPHIIWIAMPFQWWHFDTGILYSIDPKMLYWNTS